MHALTKGFNVTPEKDSLVLKKKSSILIFEERIDYVNATALYWPQGSTQASTTPKNTHRMEETWKGKFSQSQK